VTMIRAAATDTTCVPMLPPALYLTVVLPFTSAGSRPRSSEQFRMRKFDCTQPSRPAGIARRVRKFGQLGICREILLVRQWRHAADSDRGQTG